MRCYDEFMKHSLARAAALLGAFALPFLASAHEVYVLTQQEIQRDINAPSWSWWSVIAADMHTFIFWAFLGVLSVLVVFGISILRPVERACGPTLDRLKRYAPLVARVAVGISFLAPLISGKTRDAVSGTHAILQPLAEACRGSAGHSPHL